MTDNTTAKESRLSAALSKALDGEYVRIENTLSRGTPDVSYSRFYKHYWIELKVDEGEGTFIRPEQLVFMIRQHRERISVWVVSQNFKEKTYNVWTYPFQYMYDKVKNKNLITEAPRFKTTKPSKLNEIFL